MKTSYSRIRILTKFIGYGVALALAVVTSACSDLGPEAESNNTGPRPGYLTVSLASGASQTRSDVEDGNDSFNENLIDNAYIFFFKGSEDTEPADDATPDYVFALPKLIKSSSTLYVAEQPLTRDFVTKVFPSGATSAKAYAIINLPASSTTPTETLTYAELKAITIQANFNPYNPTTKELARQSNFVMDGIATITYGGNLATVESSIVAGNINLQRVASKINLSVKVQDATDSYGNTWYPDRAGMTVSLTNGVQKTSLDPSSYTLTASDYYSTGTNGHKFVANSDTSSEFTHVTDNPFYTYPSSWGDNTENMAYMTLTVPWRSEDNSYRTCYYTVPVVRGTSIGRNTSYRVSVNVGILGSFNPDEPLELTDLSFLAVPWGTVPIDTEITNYRYLILDENSFEVNNEELIAVPFYSSHNVEIKSVEVSYYIYNFDNTGNEVEIPITTNQNALSTRTAKISETVDSIYHIYSGWIDNTVNQETNTRTLYFHHPLIQWNPVTVNGTMETPVNLNGTMNQTTGLMEYSTGSLAYKKSLITKYNATSEGAYSRYTITIKIVQKDKVGQTDEASYTETINITQFPGMAIESFHNYGGTYNANRNLPGGTVGRNVNDYGYAFVNANFVLKNANNPESTNNYWNINTLGSLNYLNEKNKDGEIINNGNPNMYILTTKQLSESDNYIIGDPRLKGVNNDLSGIGTLTASAKAAGDWCHSARYLSAAGTLSSLTDSIRLTNYHPTDESNTAKNMISPKFRIASSYGEMRRAQDKEGCRRRCATYQERGYPAGRWRMPTRAELEYIAKLSNTGKIPKLFNNTIGDSEENPSNVYMTAQGPYQININGTLSTDNVTKANGKYFVRCVYDDWYWGSGYALDSASYQPISKAPTFPFIYVYGDNK